MALMTDTEKISMIKSIIGIASSDTSEDPRLAVYLTASAHEILAWRYSLSASPETDVPAEYEMTQVYAVIAGYSQSGAENQRQHSENGISRVFRHSDMVEYIRANVIPLCKVM